MSIDEEISLRNEIKELNEDNKRKARVILGLYNVIVRTEDVNLITQAGLAMADAQD